MKMVTGNETWVYGNDGKTKVGLCIGVGKKIIANSTRVETLGAGQFWGILVIF